jgi:hypothetical protein
MEILDQLIKLIKLKISIISTKIAAAGAIQESGNPENRTGTNVIITLTMTRLR